ncbi:MAG: APC family permease [bacterium]
MGEEFGLKRVIGLGGLVAIEVGTTVGAGVFSLTALAARRTGPAVPLAFVAAAVPIVFIMMTVGMLGSMLPTAGGTYRYPSRLFSPAWATVGVWCYALGLVFGAFPMYATECVHYLQAVWPHLPLKLSAILLLTLFYLVNLFGISLATQVQGLMVAVLVAALLVFGFGGLPHIEPANFDPLFAGGAGGFLVSACILTFALQGANSVIELGAEIKNPVKNIPRSLLISIPAVTVLYVLVSVSAVGSIDLKEWMQYGDNANLTQPAKTFMCDAGPAPPNSLQEDVGNGAAVLDKKPQEESGQPLGALFIFFLVGGAMFAFTTTLNGTFMWATKSLLVVANDGIMPKRLARTSRFGTPALFLTIMWGLAVVAVLLDAGIEIFAAYATIGGMIIFIPSMIAAILLPRRLPEVYHAPGYRLKGFMLYVAPGIGIITSALLILILLVDLADQHWAYPALFLVWFALGIVFHQNRKKALERRTGQSLSSVLKKDLEEMAGRMHPDNNNG